MLKNYREKVTDTKYLPAFYETIDKKFGGDYTAYAKALYKKSVLMKNDKPIYINKKSYTKDLGVQYGLDLSEVLSQLNADRKQLTIGITEQENWVVVLRVTIPQRAVCGRRCRRQMTTLNTLQNR